MRLAFTASALCLCILVFAAQQATSQAPAPSAAAPAPAPAPVSAPAPASTAAAGDAATKHAQRTACLKETKARKLLGAEKTVFLKDCIGAPPEAISASRISPPDRP
jgi:DNA polymerase-3 subunit gamma/tau